MENDDIDMNQAALQIISLSGSAKSYAIESIREYKMNNSERANDLLNEAQNLIKKVHNIQKEILEEGMDNHPTLIMIHAQDHLMTTMLLLDVIKEILV
ncbi:PTS lactose/cellobiose transporter subunit IIA [Erysipelothrix urinaevulpis]|uniref:PTS lactose/cellobiose transporter subunit IIA n=1 Tax=Erysipelothrix urinaevulpis TaxID=2683717 RepID=UPI001359EE4B|nr:PTS lactose/cellobiose transporter subunit IIA [Erysipelothrix urinaevulpis]